MDVLISVVIPVYNVAPYLRRCVDSLLNQSFSDFEIILVDDGSTDGSAAICDAYTKDNATTEAQTSAASTTYANAATAEKAHINNNVRVHVIHQPNAGVSEARNRGIEAAKGTYISFVDADDWVEPSFLEAFAEEITKHPDVDCIVQGYTDNSGRKYILPSQHMSLQQQAAEAMILQLEEQRLLGLVWNKVFRKSVLMAHQTRFATGVTIGEDMLFVLAFLLNCKKITNIAHTYYQYIVRNNSATAKEFPFEMWERQAFRFQELMDAYAKRFSQVAKAFGANQFLTSLRSIRIAYNSGIDRERRLRFVASVKQWSQGNTSISLKGQPMGNVLLGTSIQHLPPVITDALLTCVYSLKHSHSL